jgi:hypothetical protein
MARSTHSDVEQQILDHYRAQNRAMTNGDTGLLERLLDDDFVAVHIGGYRQPKNEWLEQIRSGQMAYHGIREVSATVTVTGDKAVLETRAVVDATIYGSHAAWPVQSRTTLRRKAGSWRATSSRAVLY